MVLTEQVVGFERKMEGREIAKSIKKLFKNDS